MLQQTAGFLRSSSLSKFAKVSAKPENRVVFPSANVLPTKIQNPMLRDKTVVKLPPLQNNKTMNPPLLRASVQNSG